MSEDNYTKTAKSSRARFLGYDQRNMIRRFDLEHNDDFMYISFFNQRHSINRHTGEILRTTDGAPASFGAVMGIYDVLCLSKEWAKLSGEWSANLAPPSIRTSHNIVDIWEQKQFSGRLAELKSACEKLGGKEFSNADAGYIFNIFPFLPMVFQYWEGDDELPPAVKYLFDKNTLHFMHFETAAYITGHLVDLIKTEMR